MTIISQTSPLSPLLNLLLLLLQKRRAATLHPILTSRSNQFHNSTIHARGRGRRARARSRRGGRSMVRGLRVRGCDVEVRHDVDATSGGAAGSISVGGCAGIGLSHGAVGEGSVVDV